jgi:hypothetical protein
VGGGEPADLGAGLADSSYVISANTDERFTNFGASGTLLYALVTALLLGWMFRTTEAAAHSS